MTLRASPTGEARNESDVDFPDHDYRPGGNALGRAAGGLNGDGKLGALAEPAYLRCGNIEARIQTAQHGDGNRRATVGGDQPQLLEDYRDLRGQYDKVVSIEMIEAVGHHFYDRYFGQCSALLKPDGLMLLQAITIGDQRYASARRGVDFIQRHIFPGSCIPSVAVMSGSIARATDMRLFHLEDIGPHYAKTLRRWNENLFRNLAAVKALGYSEEFIGMWEFYLCYCEAGFAERALGDVQMLLVKPLARPAALIPPLSVNQMQLR